MALILAGKIKINGETTFVNTVLNLGDSIAFGTQILQEKKDFISLAFYKPRGIETTLNREIPDNLKDILPFKEALFPVGRLDKESEGLLILTNDGRVFDKILRRENQIQKEYLVKVDKEIEDEFIQKMSEGVNILGKITLPCLVEKIDNRTFKIILVQGLNRQIRRMCYKLDYEVLQLIRLRIGTITLGELKPNEFRFYSS